MIWNKFYFWFILETSQALMLVVLFKGFPFLYRKRPFGIKNPRSPISAYTPGLLSVLYDPFFSTSARFNFLFPSGLIPPHLFRMIFSVFFVVRLSFFFVRFSVFLLPLFYLFWVILFIQTHPFSYFRRSFMRNVAHNNLYRKRDATRPRTHKRHPFRPA